MEVLKGGDQIQIWAKASLLPSSPSIMDKSGLVRANSKIKIMGLGQNDGILTNSNRSLGPVDWCPLDMLWDGWFGRGEFEIHLVCGFVDLFGPAGEGVGGTLG